MKRPDHKVLHCLIILGMLIGSFGLGLATPSAAGATESLPVAQAVTSGIGGFHLLTTDQGWVLFNNQVYWTSDGGNSWNLISAAIPGLSNIAAVDFLDLREGRVLMVATGGSDPIYSLARTHDGGRTWETSTLVLFSAGDVAAVASETFMQWLNPQTGWLVVKQATGINFSIGSLFKTVDGGKSWTKLNIPIGEPVAFISPLIGWVAGGAAGNELYRTVDGGSTWISQAFVTAAAGSLQQWVYLLPKFQDAHIGLLPVMVGDGTNSRMDFYSTVDGGQTWSLDSSAILDGNTDLSVRPPLSFLDASHFFMTVPNTDRVVIEKGAKQVLTVTNQDGRSGYLNKIDMVSLDVGLGLYLTGSCSTQPFSLNPQNTDIKGNLSCSQASQLVKTTDGGLTWNLISFPGITPLTPVPTSVVKGPVALPTPLATPNVGADVLTGQGVDICEIPNANQLEAWWENSPYGAVNIYIGGSLRGCFNSGLNASLVDTLFQEGWKFIPTWVGPQAPCTSFRDRVSSDLTTAFNQGIAQANAAISAAANLGLTYADGSHTIIYYDLEAYNTANSGCRNAMKSFMNGWDQQLAARGNKSGVYGSVCSSGMTDFWSIAHVPDDVWLAWWNYSTYNVNASVYGLACINNTYWPNHQRLHQYAGDHNETWGGVTINVDSNALDGLMAVYYQTNPNSAPRVPFNPKPLAGAIYPRSFDTWLYWNSNGSSCSLHLWGGTIDFTSSGNCASLHKGSLAPGFYNWQVTASNSHGSTTGPIWGFGIQPYAPTGLSLATVTSTHVDLGWTLSADDPVNLDGYDLYFNGVKIGSLPKGTSSASISNLACNTAYSIYLRSSRQNVQSPNSNTVTTTTSACTGGTSTPMSPTKTATATRTPTNTVNPSAPGKVSPANNASGLTSSVALIWFDPTNVSYYLYCYDSINNNACDNYWTATYSPNATISGLTMGQTYYWQVITVRSSGATYLDAGAWWSFSLTGSPSTSTPTPSATTTSVIPPTITPTRTLTPVASSTPTATATATAIGSAGAFGKLSPPSGSVGYPTSFAVNWQTVSGATYYLYCFDTVNNGYCDTFWTTSYQSSATINNLTAGNTYYWQVLAIKPSGALYGDNGIWWSVATSP